MAKMRLYYSPSSPYARKVRVLALETKLDKKIDMINVALTPVRPTPMSTSTIRSARSRRCRSRAWTSSTRR